jgi:hypothetical protein
MATGIEPASCGESTVNGDCGCVECQPPCAARALHSGGLNCQCLASLDPDLQRVIAAWDELPPAIRKSDAGVDRLSVSGRLQAPNYPVDETQIRTLPVAECGDVLKRSRQRSCPDLFKIPPRLSRGIKCKMAVLSSDWDSGKGSNAGEPRQMAAPNGCRVRSFHDRGADPQRLHLHQSILPPRRKK